MASKSSTKSEVTETIEEAVETDYTILDRIAVQAIERLDSTTERSLLAFAKQVSKANERYSHAEIAEHFTFARVMRRFPNTAPAAIEDLAKQYNLGISTSKVSQYAKTLAQMTESTVPVNESTFADWFSLTSTGSSAKARQELVDSLPEVETDDSKASTLHAVAQSFRKAARSTEPRAITLQAALNYLERIQEQDWSPEDAQELSEALFNVGASVADSVPSDQVERETVAA